MIKEYLSKVELLFAWIPPHILAIVGDTPNYKFSQHKTPPTKKVLWTSVGARKTEVEDESENEE